MNRSLSEIQTALLEELIEFIEEKSAIKNEYEQIRLKNIATKNEFNPTFRTGIRENMEGIGEYLDISDDVLFEQSMKDRLDSLEAKESDLLYDIYMSRIPTQDVADILGIKRNAYHSHLEYHTTWYRAIKEHGINVKREKEKKC